MDEEGAKEPEWLRYIIKSLGYTLCTSAAHKYKPASNYTFIFNLKHAMKKMGIKTENCGVFKCSDKHFKCGKN